MSSYKKHILPKFGLINSEDINNNLYNEKINKYYYNKIISGLKKVSNKRNYNIHIFLNMYYYIPFYHFLLVITNFLLNKGFNVIIQRDLNFNVDKEDIIIFFLGDSINDKIQNKNCRKILINSESLLVKNWLKRYNKILSNNNIIFVLDYTYKNIQFSNKSNYCPLLYSSVLEEYIKANKSIDILFYGSKNQRRTNIINRIKTQLPNINFIYNVNTCENIKKHFDYIFSSKIVLVIHYYPEDLPIDYYRISHLLSNKILIIHEDVQEEDKISKEYEILKKHNIFCPYNLIPQKCRYLLQLTQIERDEISNNLYNDFKEHLTLDKYFPLDKLIPK